MLRFLLILTIVAAIPVRLATAATASEDVPLPGGRAALAAALGIDPVPDRGRFVSEVARLVHGLADRKPRAPEVLAQELRGGAASGVGIDELVPVPLTAAVWSKAVFRRAISPRELVLAILGDRQAALLCHGLAALDDQTLQYLADHPSVLTEIYTLGAEPFAVFASTLRIDGGRIVPPGDGDAIALWEDVVDAPVTRPDRFIASLFTRGEGRLSSLYDTIGHLDRPRQRFALGLWIDDSLERLGAMRALAAASIAASGAGFRTQPFVRQPYDLTAMLMRVRVDPAGRPASPSSRSFWSRVIEGADLPDDPAGLLRTAADDRPFDAAFLARLVAAGDVRLRAERADQFAFGQRMFAATPAAEMPDVFVATRAFRRYRMLMVTLERIGVRRPAVYAAAARLATRMSPQDPARAFVATAQFQGALGLLSRIRSVGTIDAARAETLVAGLLAVPLNSSSQYLGGILRWLSEDLRSAIPPASSLEAAVQAAVAGPASTAATPPIEWEGQRYRIDVAAAERRRLERIREKQSGVTLDMALDLAAAARTLTTAPPTVDGAQRISLQLKSIAEELSAASRRDAVLDTDGFPPGVVPPPSVLARVPKVIDELGRIGGNATDPLHAARAAVELVDAADEAAAQALVALVYAINLGDPDGDALLPADVSRRHDFGLGQRDNEQRLRAPWMMPRQDVSPGVSWHVDGSLLGLDVALATVSLRRLNTDRALGGPTLTSNERETFAAGFGLMNPFALTDAARDAIAEAIDGGRRRLSLIANVADLAAVADEINMDGWRRRSTRWTLEHEPERLELFFSLGELVVLGRAGRDIDLDPWGTAAILSTGCVCTRMPSPGGLALLVGRRQLGLLATAVPDLNLHIARMLAHLHIPTRLAKYVLSAAVQDFVDEVRATDPDDWLSLVRGARAMSLERIEDYVAAAAADGPLMPDSAR